MAEQTVKMKTTHWYGDDPIEITFPERWDVHTRLMAGHDLPPLTQEEIRSRIMSPIGSRRLSEIAEGRETAVIVFSDLTRADDPQEVLPGIMEELRLAGIKDDGVTFISGLGGHGTMTRLEWAMKLGEDTVTGHRVFNHNVYDHFE